MTFNIGPDTIVQPEDVPVELRKYHDRLHIDNFLANGIPVELTDLLKKYQLTMTLNGMFYRTDKKGFIAEIVSEVFTQRKAEKNLMLDYEKQLEAVEIEMKNCDEDRLKVLLKSQFNLETMVSIHHNTQLALKTLMNALYGAMGNEFFRHFNFYNAEGITSSGQYAIQYNTQKVDAYINKLCGTNQVNAIYNDTDSISVSLESVIKKVGVSRDDANYIDAVCKFADTSLNKQTKIACADIADRLNVFENKLSFKREKVFLSGLYVVKKRYALLVVDEEGVRFGEPKVKITGLDIKRSDTPKKCREAMKKALMIILSGTESELQNLVIDFEKEFKGFTPSEIALPTGVNNLLKYSDVSNTYIKGTPIHVKAALIHNREIIKRNLSNKYELIEEGNKMKYIKLNIPNPVFEPIIGFIDKIPTEFDVDNYVNYAQMFEDTFAKATRKMVEAAGWNMEPVTNVEDWFS